MKKYEVCLCLLFISTQVKPQSNVASKQYRSDYVYNRKTDAFYKLHIENRPIGLANQICSIEGGKLMTPSRPDIIQLHRMFKEFPDIGNYAWVDSDGQQHESAEENPIIDLSLNNEAHTRYYWSKDCDVVTRKGEIESAFCFREYPFICKVDAKDMPYDNHCHVYARDYKYFADVGSCYKIPRIAYSWNEAYAECQNENAHLVVLNSEAEMLAVKNLIKTEPPVTGARVFWFFLAGFRANKPLGNSTKEFKTIFNQTLQEAGYSQWSRNEPNNANSNEDCGSIFKNDGKLNDVECSQSYGFICEKEINA